MKLSQILVLIFFTTALSGQNTVIPSALRASMTLDRIPALNALAPGNAIPGMPLQAGKVIGDSYLAKNWSKGSVLLYQSETIIEGYPLRYDIAQNELEINTKNGVKVLASNKIRNFTWIDSLSKTPVFFVNAKEYADEAGTALSGFFEVISDGTILVLKKTLISVKKANYIPALDAGTRDDEILKNDKFYYANANKVYALPTSKKKFLPIFKDKAEKMEEFIELNDMSLKEAHHIKAIFEYYNSLIK